MNRTKTLEERVAALEQQIEALIERDRGWSKLSQAADALTVSTDTLRRKIRYAQAFPKESPFKKGTHWRTIGSQYQIHVGNWERLEARS